MIKKFYTLFSNEITKVSVKEARLLNTIDHKNIVKLLGVSTFITVQKVIFEHAGVSEKLRRSI